MATSASSGVGLWVVVGALLGWFAHEWARPNHFTVHYMAPHTMAEHKVEVDLVATDNSDSARADVVFLCNGLEQWQDEGVDPVNHRWCLPEN